MMTSATSPIDQMACGALRSGTVGHAQQWTLIAASLIGEGSGNSACEPTIVDCTPPETVRSSTDEKSITLPSIASSRPGPETSRTRLARAEACGVLIASRTTSPGSQDHSSK
ncbi:hypothetical protein IF803_35205 [Bradyrhizobium sp. UFLA06-06]